MGQGAPRRLTRLGVLVGLAGLAACAGQQPPERSALPEVAAVVDAARSCVFLAGEGTGVRVDEVVAGSAADGVLQPGDLLVGLDGRNVASTADVFRLLSGKEVGDRLELEVERDGALREAVLTLTANPDDPSRPRIGIAIVTRFDEVEPATLAVGARLGAHSRLVEVDGLLYGLDPVSAVAVPTGVEPPESPWFAAGGTLYRLEGAGTDSARIVGDDGTRIEIADAGITPYQVVGAVDGSLVVGLAGTDGAVYLARVNPTSPPETVWTAEIEEASGVPGAAFASPDGDRVLVVGFPPGAEGPFRLRVLDAATGEEVVGDQVLGDVRPAVAFGWFDDRRVVVQTQEGGIALLSVADGELEAVQLRVAVEEGDRLFPVGDGVHLLIARPFELLRSGLEASVETRRLITRCDVGAIGLPGSAG